MTKFFISGIDTDIGKTEACGAIARALIKLGYRTFTQKLVETGTDGNSKDLVRHAEIVGFEFNTAGTELHCPYQFELPASPHLAAELAGERIDIGYLNQQIVALEQQCDCLLIEGAGGLCVPLNSEQLIADLIKQLTIPLILVTSARLGSINHSLLSMSYCQQMGIELAGIVYNHYGQTHSAILQDSRDTIKTHLKRSFPEAIWLDLFDGESFYDSNAGQINQLVSRQPHLTTA